MKRSFLNLLYLSNSRVKYLGSSCYGDVYVYVSLFMETDVHKLWPLIWSSPHWRTSGHTRQMRYCHRNMTANCSALDSVIANHIVASANGSLRPHCHHYETALERAHLPLFLLFLFSTYTSTNTYSNNASPPLNVVLMLAHLSSFAHAMGKFSYLFFPFWEYILIVSMKLRRILSFTLLYAIKCCWVRLFVACRNLTVIRRFCLRS